MKHWLVRTPGNFYPFDIYADSEAEARAKARKFEGVTRLPAGTDVWEFTPESQRIVRESQRRMAADYTQAGQIFDP